MASMQQISIEINEDVHKLLLEVKEKYTWKKATVPPKEYGAYHVWAVNYDESIENGWETVLIYHHPGEWEKIHDNIVVTHYCPRFDCPPDLEPEEWEAL